MVSSSAVGSWLSVGAVASLDPTHPDDEAVGMDGAPGCLVSWRLAGAYPTHRDDAAMNGAPRVWWSVDEWATWRRVNYEARIGIIHRKMNVAVMAPASWAAMKGRASVGRIPAKVSVRQRASVTAGLANEVELVNQ